MPAERAPQHVVRDLSRKAGDDVTGAVRRTIDLLEHPQDRVLVSLAALNAALIVAVKSICEKQGIRRPENPEELFAAGEQIMKFMGRGEIQ